MMFRPDEGVSGLWLRCPLLLSLASALSTESPGGLASEWC